MKGGQGWIPVAKYQTLKILFFAAGLLPRVKPLSLHQANCLSPVMCAHYLLYIAFVKGTFGGMYYRVSCKKLVARLDFLLSISGFHEFMDKVRSL